MEKFYCYVDETGQDTAGELFLVAVVLTDEEKIKVREQLLGIENTSKRRKLKWNKTDLKRKRKYLHLLLTIPSVHCKIYFSNYKNTEDYMYLTAFTTAKAVLKKAKKDYKVTVLVDGLKRKEVRQFSRILYKFDIKIKKVRGIKDESDVLIRLADSMAGFIRDAIEKQSYTTDIYKRFLDKNFIKKV
jgi:hypothetical protein